MLIDIIHINYLHAKFQINVLKNKKIIKLLELWTLWLKKEKRKKLRIQKSCYHNSENSEYKRVVITTLKIANTNTTLKKKQDPKI